MNNEIISFVIVMYWLRLALSAVSVVLRAFARSEPNKQTVFSERWAGYSVFRVREKMLNESN